MHNSQGREAVGADDYPLVQRAIISGVIIIFAVRADNHPPLHNFEYMIDKMVVTERAEQFLRDSESESFLVDVLVKPGNLIVVEIDSEEGIDIDECVALSRFIEAGLDREVEDFELEVGSAGITSPFKVLRQYQKNIGNPVEVLSRTGIKTTGVLKSADEHGFVVGVTKMVKPEGAKRKMAVEEDLPFKYDDIKYTKYSFGRQG